jgi:hypothetical protein
MFDWVMWIGLVLGGLMALGVVAIVLWVAGTLVLLGLGLVATVVGWVL